MLKSMHEIVRILECPLEEFALIMSAELRTEPPFQPVEQANPQTITSSSTVYCIAGNIHRGRGGGGISWIGQKYAKMYFCGFNFCVAVLCACLRIHVLASRAAPHALVCSTNSNRPNGGSQ